MAKNFIQLYWDILRGKEKRGALVDMDGNPSHYGNRYIYSNEEAQSFIQALVEAKKPALVVRPGSIELQVIAVFLNQISKPQCIFPPRYKRKASINAGIFNPSDSLLTRFACESLSIFRDADIYSAFGTVQGERIICENYVPSNCILTQLSATFTTGVEMPWTQALQGKKVLVVHPFADTIEKQYKKRETLFSNPLVLPEFELKTIKAVQTSANSKSEFQDWHSALNHMKEQIDQTEFDVALVGAGAYGYFLAHHCKKIGKIGIHMASSIQLLFGIKGARWLGSPSLEKLMNENWVFPAEHEKPKEAHLVEGGCYW